MKALSVSLERCRDKIEERAEQERLEVWVSGGSLGWPEPLLTFPLWA